MPEGHTIRRYADLHRQILRGRQVAVSSPQGRFRKGAARLDGRKLADVDAHGKHLFYRWHRAETLHIHLGLYGRFRLHRSEPPPPTAGTRLAMKTDTATIYLSGPSTCELILPSQEEDIMARLGPDPLKAGQDGNTVEVFARNLGRRRIPIGAALLDQSVIAGIGNIYRAECLFVAGVDPATPAVEVPAAKVRQLWETSVGMLERGVTEGVIRTLPGDRGTGRKETDRLYVYNRQRFPCRVCGGPISNGEMANRSIWWCRTCQPATPA